MHPRVQLVGGAVPAHVPGSYPRLSCCGGPVALVPASDSEEFGNALERAIRELEAARKYLVDSDSRADPLNWVVDRLTEMAAVGEELVPDWYHRLKD